MSRVCSLVDKASSVWEFLEFSPPVTANIQVNPCQPVINWACRLTQHVQWRIVLEQISSAFILLLMATNRWRRFPHSPQWCYVHRLRITPIYTNKRSKPWTQTHPAHRLQTDDSSDQRLQQCSVPADLRPYELQPSAPVTIHQLLTATVYIFNGYFCLQHS